MRTGLRTLIGMSARSGYPQLTASRAEWTPRELRHSFVFLLSDAGVPLENISRLVGHSGSAVTKVVYRKQLRPVMIEGAETMGLIFGQRPE
jgi:integrase